VKQCNATLLYPIVSVDHVPSVSNRVTLDQQSEHQMELNAFGVQNEALRFWMPPACPGEPPVSRYTRSRPLDRFRFPSGGFAAAGETEEWGDAVCSKNRNNPPGKPGAFVNSQSLREQHQIPFGASALSVAD
jgi:hypothetical protein